MRPGLSARQGANLTVSFLDLLGMAALFGTGELGAASLLLPLLLSPLLFRPFFRLPPRALLAALGIAVAATFSAWHLFGAHPVTAAMHALPSTHALLWLLPRTDQRHLGWRAGLGLAELIVASVVSTELWIPLCLLAFVVSAALALSCAFLDQEFAARAPALRDAPLPRGFLRRVSLQCLLMLFMTALIFPILPRPRGSASLGWGRILPGYTEKVGLSEWSPMTSSGDTQTVLRLYPPDGIDLTTEIGLGLIRSVTLDAFDGKNWKRLLKRGGKPAEAGGPTITVEAVREAIDSEAFPAPYGTLGLQELESGHIRPVSRRDSGEWLSPFARGRRVRYQFQLSASQKDRSGREKTDPPREENRAVPPVLRTERMQRLARRIFANARTDRERVSRLSAFFATEKYSAVPGMMDEYLTKSLSGLAFAPLEQFLFITRQGHCEWFASSAALLLRFAGIPTRLVTGFRIASPQLGGTLSLRNADAHAWLEYWSEERGWTPLDPTPRVLLDVSVSEYLLRLADLLSAYWYRLVVTYEGNPWQSLRSAANGFTWSGLPLGLAGGGLLLALAYALSRRGRASAPRYVPDPARRGLPRVRRKLERRLAGHRLGPETLLALREWLNAYEAARFGPPEALESGLTELENARVTLFLRLSDPELNTQSH
ncbi:MAG: DUF3488 and transglutaminase-like domain-containing protein [Oligoflexia bacterium]|nr:DUF3488 and transglutaminase-like domain-containing protein [Oligoflexia bacterium]